MTSNKRKYRTIYFVTAALMVAMVGGYALASTTFTTLTPGQTSNVTNTPNPTGFAAGTIVSQQLVVLTPAMAGVGTAGNSTAGSIGLAGTPYLLPKCAGAPCTVRDYKPANQATILAGDYAEQIVINISQPLSTGNSVPFDFSMLISITIETATPTTTTVGAQGFLATNVASVGTGQTIPVYLFVDLGTTTTVVINSISVVFNVCSSANACP
jgi:hypothetical protein